MTSPALDIIYASGKTTPLSTLELTCSAWTESILACNGFTDKVCTTEGARVLLFEAMNIQVALPRKSNAGTQSLRFGFSNIDGRAQRLIDQAIDAEAHCFLTLRIYDPANLTVPAEPPYRMRVTGGTMLGPVAQVDAGFGDIIARRFQSRMYTTKEFRGLTYT